MEKIRYYKIKELAYMLGISEKSVRNKISNLKLKRIKTVGPEGYALYTDDQLNTLRSDKRLNSLQRGISYEQLLHERHQTPIVNTYYIYESKIN